MQYVYPFGPHLPKPPLDRNLLGIKAKNLAEMSSIGIPVPAGIIITTEACNEYRRNQRRLSEELQKDITISLKLLSELTGAEFGNAHHPFLVSVRSGARVSMPGMMDTILNLGLNDETVHGFAKVWQNERLAYDSYRRFIMMYSNVVNGIPRKQFEQAMHIIKMEEGVEEDVALSVHGLKRTCDIFKKIHMEKSGEEFTQNCHKQLFNAISAVFDSWHNERATLYREIHQIPDEWGTAVIIQTMVFGNRNNHSATGVAFTRNPATGERAFYGEFLVNAQGEEVVAGTRTPHPLNKHQQELTGSSRESLEELMPDTYEELLGTVQKLETYYTDMQDIEFTIEDGRLYLLQTRVGKRTGFAAVRIAVEMLQEGLIDEKTALKRIEPEQLTQLLAPIFDTNAKLAAKDRLVARGLNASPGAASGKVALSAQKAIEWKLRGIPAVLVREEADPNDFSGMVAAEGILTIRGGSTSHAAIVARGMGKPCVVGCTPLSINEEAKTITAGNTSIHEGDPIAIDGLTGDVFFCALPTSHSEIVQVLVTKTKKPKESLLFMQYNQIMMLADKYRKLRIRCNADNPQDSIIARAFGAEGIGLCRTEHMFMLANRLSDVRHLFFSTQPEERKKAIERLLPHQKEDLIGIFRAMDGLPVTIRLLDPPLHEFMPHTDEEISNLALNMKISREKLMEIRFSIEEENPMLGHRGCRLGITYPELTEMQTRVILEAALEVAAEGIKVFPEIMIPLVGIYNEIVHQKTLIEKTAEKVFSTQGKKINYSIGTMIELPRAVLIADEIAQSAEFFSFGTNDLTQTIFGISRDDSSKFVPLYLKGIPNPLNNEEISHILSEDPFQVIDRQGVGQMMQIALKKGKESRPDLKCGICGEHGGDPSSIKFCHEIGLDYVSCSPYRIPIARLAAAVANLT